MNKPLSLKRLPETKNNSLKAWNAADELLVEFFSDKSKQLGIYNDTFGYLTCHFASEKPIVVINQKSQEAAIQKNLNGNGIPVEHNLFFNLTDEIHAQLDYAILKIPKSLGLLEVYFNQIHQCLSSEGEVTCGFMTKYFNSGILKLAHKYFDHVEQTKAKKKARLLILKGKKTIEKINLFESFEYNNLQLKQYRGVFSSGKVDLATDFLLQNLPIPAKHDTVLDLACGNGIIGKWILEKAQVNQMHFLDDSNLAIASAKINLAESHTKFHHHFDLSLFEDESFDWIIINPPFHFGNTVDTSIAIGLFHAAQTKLKKGGTLTIVANSNLGYEPILKSLFDSVQIYESNWQFKIYVCLK